MSRTKELLKLGVLADLMLDHQLMELKKRADAKEQSITALERLGQTPIAAEGLEGAAGALAGLAYQRWADARRAEINQRLAGQTHDWMVARDAARLAFGRAEALRKLSANQALHKHE